MSVSPLRVAVATAVAAVLLSACSSGPTAAPVAAGTSTTSAAPTPTATPPTSARAAQAPTASPGPAVKPGPVTLLPWPTADPARLQAAVDAGTTPWLLDPTDLALSYVTATYGWAAADASPAAGTPAATKVDVRNTDGKQRTLTVAQRGHTGKGGIWVVTADAPA